MKEKMMYSTTYAEQQKSKDVAEKHTTNVLNFNHFSEEYTFWFSDSDAKDLHRVYKSIVPDEVIEDFGEQEHYFTSFDQQLDDLFPVTKKTKPLYKTIGINGEGKKQKVKNAAFSNSLLRRYYNHRITSWFSSRELVKSNFIDDVEIWLKNNTSHPQFYIFEKYILKVQFAKITRKPELVVIYAGKSKVYKKNVAELSLEVSPECFKWVLYSRSFYKYDDKLPNEIKQNLNKVYPVWNFKLRDALHEKPEAADRTNKYKKFKSKVDSFNNKYLKSKDFKAVLSFDNNSFITVPEAKIGRVKETSNQLIFGGKTIDVDPFNGIKKNGPFETPQNPKIQFFFIFHTDDTELCHSLNDYFKNKHQTFPGLYNYVKIPFSTVEKFNITFKDKLNAIPEIESKIRERNFNSDTEYMAIYVSPHKKSSCDRDCNKIYYRVKEILLKRGISSQVIDAATVRQAKNNNIRYDYHLNNISIAILAKLNGVPWQLNTKLKRELVVGVGAFKSMKTKTQYLGSAFSFTNTGRFNAFQCFRKNEIDKLAGAIIDKVKDFAAVNPDIKRLVIHFYKNMNKRELEPIEKGLRNLGLDIPVFIVTINKTESEDITAFDEKWDGLMPLSGTFMNIGFNRFLLFNNTRYNADTYKSSNGYPFPIKLSIKCTHEELANDYQTIKELIDQVYQFSRIYWKSVKQQNLPVTIKYPELVAEIASHFESDDIYIGPYLWFL